MSKLDDTIAGLTYDSAGLIPAIVVDGETRQVLMLAYMNAESLRRTLRTGKTHFWSRSRGRYWMKGESSGHTQEVRAIYADCDGDTLLLEVTQRGGACHEGYRSCFFRRLGRDGQWDVVAEKVFDPDRVYPDGA